MDSAADKRDQIQSRVENSLRRRHAKEKRFKMFGLAAVLIGLSDGIISMFFSPTLAKMLATLAVAMILVFRPQGLFGAAAR